MAQRSLKINTPHTPHPKPLRLASSIGHNLDSRGGDVTLGGEWEVQKTKVLNLPKAVARRMSTFFNGGDRVAPVKSSASCRLSPQVGLRHIV